MNIVLQNNVSNTVVKFVPDVTAKPQIKIILSNSNTVVKFVPDVTAKPQIKTALSNTGLYKVGPPIVLCTTVVYDLDGGIF